MYNIIYETSCQSRFDALYWMLGAGALGRTPTSLKSLFNVTRVSREPTFVFIDFSLLYLYFLFQQVLSLSFLNHFFLLLSLVSLCSSLFNLSLNVYFNENNFLHCYLFFSQYFVYIILQFCDLQVAVQKSGVNLNIISLG